LLIPLLADSLEKAVQLAEAMEARGYGQKSQISNLKSQMLMAGGLSGLLMGWLVEVYWRTGIGWAVIAASAVAFMLGLRTVAAHAPRTTSYKRLAWSERDTLLAVLSAVPLAVIAAMAILAPLALTFYPYPRVTLPPFDVRLGICLALLAAPAFVRPRNERLPMTQSAAAGK
jgi:energy-coupling factor transport system permease protein